MTDPTSEEIVDALRAAGWLLEQDTYGALLGKGFSPRMGRAYRDPDEPTVSRELDVWAYRQFCSDETNRYSVGAHVLAECKASNTPYVAVGRPTEDHERVLPVRQHSLPYGVVRVPTERGHSEVPAWSHFQLHALPGSSASEEFRATQLTRLERRKKWEADNRGIFNSLVFPLGGCREIAGQGA